MGICENSDGMQMRIICLVYKHAFFNVYHVVFLYKVTSWNYLSGMHNIAFLVFYTNPCERESFW